MDFSFNKEQEIFCNAIQAFASKGIAPGVDDREEANVFPRDMWEIISDYGLTGLCIPEEYGGSGADALTTVMALVTFTSASRDISLAGLWATHLLLAAMPIADLGNEQQKQKYLPKMATGEWIGAMALTEPSAGSDATALRTTAKKESDHYLLNGSKTFISNAPIADVIVVFASTDLSQRAGGLSIFIVDRDSPGLTVTKPMRTHIGSVWPTGELFFENCRVPEENRLGGEGSGFKSMLTALGWERMAFSPYVGLMEADLELCIQYVKERKQFGRPIGAFQLVQALIAEMKMDLEASRHLVYHLAWKKDQGANIALDAAIAKTFITEAAERVSRKAVQVFGGYGGMKSMPIGRSLWTSKLSTIGGGTSQIQRTIIGKMLTGL